MCQTLCLGARPRYSLVVDEDVKKPTNQPTLSLIQPFDASLVSCRVAMSILRRFSSSLMMAVLLASSTCCRTSESPEHIVLTFQVASLKNGSLFLFLCFVLPGAGFTVCSLDFVLSLKHPLRQADCDGLAPYWPGAARLEAGDS